jgi:hypothetical protein
MSAKVPMPIWSELVPWHCLFGAVVPYKKFTEDCGARTQDESTCSISKGCAFQ